MAYEGLYRQVANDNWAHGHAYAQAVAQMEQHRAQQAYQQQQLQQQADHYLQQQAHQDAQIRLLAERYGTQDEFTRHRLRNEDARVQQGAQRLLQPSAAAAKLQLGAQQDSSINQYMTERNGTPWGDEEFTGGREGLKAVQKQGAAYNSEIAKTDKSIEDSEAEYRSYLGAQFPGVDPSVLDVPNDQIPIIPDAKGNPAIRVPGSKPLVFGMEIPNSVQGTKTGLAGVRERKLKTEELKKKRAGLSPRSVPTLQDALQYMPNPGAASPPQDSGQGGSQMSSRIMDANAQAQAAIDKIQSSNLPPAEKQRRVQVALDRLKSL